MTHTRITVDRPATAYTDVRCSTCAAPLTPVFDGTVTDDGVWDDLQADHALHVTLDGGYGEFLDVGETDDDLHLLLCQQCAQRLVDTFPALTPIVARHINCNVGHVCVDGQLTWIAQSACSRDPDAHGWRTVHIVTDGARHLVAHHVADTDTDAQAWIDARPDGAWAVHTTPVGNLGCYTRPDGTRFADAGDDPAS